MRFIAPYNVGFSTFRQLYLTHRGYLSSGDTSLDFYFRKGLMRSDLSQVYPYNPLERLFEMARSKPNKNARSFGTLEFINIRLAANEKIDFDAWLAKGDKTTLKAVHQACQNDAKLSISWDGKNDAFIAALTGREDGINEGKCITIRSATWERAVFAIAYVSEVMFSGGVWESTEDGGLA